MQTKTDLLAVAEILKSGWCQGQDAISSQGYPTDPLSSDAACFCLTGACCKVSGEAWYMPRSVEIRNAIKVYLREHDPENKEFMDLERYNDKKGRTQKEVVDLVLSVAASL